MIIRRTSRMIVLFRSDGLCAYSLNLEAEALAQLRAATSNSEYDYYEEGSATRRVRLDYVRERLRLLYVGITRARKELVVTWNSGRKGDAILHRFHLRR